MRLDTGTPLFVRASGEANGSVVLESAIEWAFVEEGSVNAVDRLTVSETAEQPNPTAEEFQESVETLQANSPFADGLRNG